jgi:hypothetical protein
LGNLSAQKGEDSGAERNDSSQGWKEALIQRGDEFFQAEPEKEYNRKLVSNNRQIHCFFS